jgi:hypothetical protein
VLQRVARIYENALRARAAGAALEAALDADRRGETDPSALRHAIETARDALRTNANGSAPEPRKRQSSGA